MFPVLPSGLPVPQPSSCILHLWDPSLQSTAEDFKAGCLYTSPPNLAQNNRGTQVAVTQKTNVFQEPPVAVCTHFAQAVLPLANILDGCMGIYRRYFFKIQNINTRKSLWKTVLRIILSLIKKIYLLNRHILCFKMFITSAVFCFCMS